MRTRNNVRIGREKSHRDNLSQTQDDSRDILRIAHLYMHIYREYNIVEPMSKSGSTYSRATRARPNTHTHTHTHTQLFVVSFIEPSTVYCRCTCCCRVLAAVGKVTSSSRDRGRGR